MRRLLAGLVLFGCTLSTYAAVEDPVWKAVLNRDVTIEMNDGSTVSGQLTNIDDQVVVLIAASGKVVSVEKSAVREVRVDTAAHAAKQAEAADVPVTQAYLLVDPLGFLQIGPAVEVGMWIGPSTLIGVAWRFEGLGLLTQALGSSSTSTLDPLSMGFQGMLYQLLPGSGPNRWYIQGLVGYGWGATSGDEGTIYAWRVEWSHLELAVGVGYRWRFPSRFFLDLGAVGGAGIGMTSVSLTTALAMLQLHLGWDL
jgi:small nuclear ribonucleoprotein (snRNP)-like protein